MTTNKNILEEIAAKASKNRDTMLSLFYDRACIAEALKAETTDGKQAGAYIVGINMASYLAITGNYQLTAYRMQTEGRRPTGDDIWKIEPEDIKEMATRKSKWVEGTIGDTEGHIWTDTGEEGTYNLYDLQKKADVDINYVYQRAAEDLQPAATIKVDIKEAKAKMALLIKACELRENPEPGHKYDIDMQLNEHGYIQITCKINSTCIYTNTIRYQTWRKGEMRKQTIRYDAKLLNRAIKSLLSGQFGSILLTLPHKTDDAAILEDADKLGFSIIMPKKIDREEQL